MKKGLLLWLIYIFSVGCLYAAKLPLADKTNKRFGPVKSGMTISLIAQKIRPDKTYSINKIAQYLYESNKGSFTKADINRIKLGSYLLLPDLEQPKFRKNNYLNKQLKSKKVDQESQVKKESMAKKRLLSSEQIKPISVLNKNQNFEKILPIDSKNYSREKINYADNTMERELAYSKISNKLSLIEKKLEQRSQDQTIARLQINHIKTNLEKLNQVPFKEINLAQIQLTHQLLNMESRHLSSFNTLLIMNGFILLFFIVMFIYLRKLSRRINKVNHFGLGSRDLYYTSGRMGVRRRASDDFSESSSQDKNINIDKEVDFSHLMKNKSSSD